VLLLCVCKPIEKENKRGRFIISHLFLKNTLGIHSLKRGGCADSFLCILFKTPPFINIPIFRIRKIKIGKYFLFRSIGIDSRCMSVQFDKGE
jgi:hypothetical protein